MNANSIPVALTSPRRRVLIVHNPTAGTASPGRLTAVMANLERRGIACHLAASASPEAVSRLLRDDATTDAVIAAGGDGTLRALAAAVLASPRPDVPIGLIPLGTGNVMAREIGLGFSAAAIAATIAEGPTITIRAARANDVLFLLMAGAGLDAEIVARLGSRLKRWIGRAAYAGPTLRVLLSPRPKLVARIDGVAFTCAWVIATRSRHYGGSFILARDARLSRSDLVAVLFQPASNADLVRQMLALAAGQLDGARGVLHIPCHRVEVSAEPSAATQIDGDVLARTPLTISVDGPTVQLIVPPVSSSP